MQLVELIQFNAVCIGCWPQKYKLMNIKHIQLKIAKDKVGTFGSAIESWLQSMLNNYTRNTTIICIVQD